MEQKKERKGKDKTLRGKKNAREGESERGRD